MKLLFFMQDTPEENNRIRGLVRENYPGLLEKGYVTWRQLDYRRYRRAGGFSLEFAQSVVANHNDNVNEQNRIQINNMESWNTNYDGILRAIPDVKVTNNNYEIPTHEHDGDRQLVYTNWPKPTSGKEVKEEYVNMVNLMGSIESQSGVLKYINTPWHHEDNDPEIPMSGWNLVLNQSVANIAVNSNPDKFNLRIVVPDDIEKYLSRSKFYKGELRAVLLLRYHDEDNYIQTMPKDRLPPNVKPKGFVPLFIYSNGGTYSVYNYRGDQVEWGDFSKRRSYFYYELRDVMAHLANPNEDERWYMYELPKGENSVLKHYIVGKKYLGNENRKCITWKPDSLGIVEYHKNCMYEGSDMDMKRAGESLEESLELYMERNKLEGPVQPDTKENEYEVVFNVANLDLNTCAVKHGDNPPPFKPPNKTMAPRNLGIYAESHDDRNNKINHLTSAWATWNEIIGKNDNPLKALSCIMEEYKKENTWIDEENTPIEYRGGASFFTGLLGISLVVMGSLFGSAL